MKLTMLLGMAVLAGLSALAPAARAQDRPGDKPGEKPAEQPAEAHAPKPQEGGPVYALMKTTDGNITLELNRDKAPVSVENFLRYAEKGFYNGTIFHRVLPNFMIQGGGFTPEMTLKETDAPIKNEWENGLKNDTGTIAMARLRGRPDSASSQFFINVARNTSLDKPADGAGYAVFGRVVDGMDVVTRIKAGETKENAKMGNEKSLPISPVRIEQVRRLTPDEVKALKERIK
jgi:peptidyl-prolyl cis-trans isomerase A (cyclophilin A)